MTFNIDNIGTYSWMNDNGYHCVTSFDSAFRYGYFYNNIFKGDDKEDVHVYKFNNVRFYEL